MTEQKNTIKLSPIVSLPIREETEDKVFIPAAIHFEKGNQQVLEQVALGVKLNKPMMLVGETGTGKTSAIRWLANQTRTPFRRVNLNGATSVDDLVGKTLLNKEGTYWLDGVLIDAMRKGHWILLDEVNAASAEVLFVLHSLLDDDGYVVLAEKDGEVVKPHRDFRLFATMNPSADYQGTKELNRAFLSRFLVVKTDFLTPRFESKVLAARSGIPYKVAEALVKFAGEVRSMAEKQKIQFVLSTRELLQWGELWQAYGGKYIPGGELSVINKLNASDVVSVKDLMGLHFKKLDGLEEKTEGEEIAFKIGDKVEIINEEHYRFTGIGSKGEVVVSPASSNPEAKVGVDFSTADLVKPAHRKISKEKWGLLLRLGLKKFDICQKDLKKI